MEKAFNVHLNQYRMPEGRVAYANDAAPRLPASVAARLSGIIGLDNMVLAKPHSAAGAADVLDAVRPLGALPARRRIGSGRPSGGLTPADIKNIYNLTAVAVPGRGPERGDLRAGRRLLPGRHRRLCHQYSLPTDAGAFVNRATSTGTTARIGP